jgi:hypothetical protein
MIGRTVALVCIIVWLIIFVMAFIYGNNHVVRVTIKANVFHEFWFEFILLSVGLVGFIYDIYRRRLEDSKKDRKQGVEVESSSSE